MSNTCKWDLSDATALILLTEIGDKIWGIPLICSSYSCILINTNYVLLHMCSPPPQITTVCFCVFFPSSFSCFQVKLEEGKKSRSLSQISHVYFQEGTMRLVNMF